MNPQKFPYLQSHDSSGLQEKMPFLSLSLRNQTHSVLVSALVDSGSTINVLPFDVGIQLGLIWESQTYSLLSLVENLQGLPTFGVLLERIVEPFAPVPLAFAWTESNEVPVILGQINFFAEFDVHFWGSQKVFQIAPKQRDNG